MSREETGTPYAPHGVAETETMLDALGVDEEAALFDIPDSVAFDGEFDIEARSEQTVRREVRETLSRTEDLAESRGRGH
jgi:glycine dehydrogenase subunit 1